MGTKSSISTTTIPSEVAANYNSAMGRVAQAAGANYQRYSNTGSDFVAPLTATQQSGVAGANTYANYAQPYYGEATDMLHGTMSQVDPYYGTATDYADQSGRNIYAGGLDVNQYLNPYLQYTLGNTQALLNQSNQQAMAGQLGSAISQGAFGGDRAGIAAANLRQQQQMAEGKIYSDILSGGYDTAMGVAQKQQAQALAADQANRAAALAASQQYQGLGKDIYGMSTGMARQLAETGLGAQEAGLAGAKAQLEAGGVEQATEQATKDALIKQFMAEQGYPFQVAEFMADQYSKLGPLYGQTTTTRSKSDVRLKEDIKHIGKTFDGQPIYSYRFKDHPQTQIGLMAQEVEQHHPHAVSNDPDGYKSVDYAEATEHAAKRGHFAVGGVIPSSQGGSVDYSNAGEGFAAGGTPYDMSVPGLGGMNPYETDEERRRRGSGPSGGPRPGLAPAPPVPEQPSAAQQAKDATATATNAMALGSAAKGMMGPPATSLVKAPAISGVTGGTAANTLGGSASLTPTSMASITNPAALNSLGGGASLTPTSMASITNPAALNTLGGGASLTPAVTSGSALAAPGAAATAPTLGSVGAGLGHTIGATGAGLGHAAGTALSAVPQALGAVGSGMGSAGTALAGGHLGTALGAAGHGLLAGGSALAGGLGTAAATAGTALAAGAAGVGTAMASILPAIASLFMLSDERLKEDVKPVGKTFDGQTVYSYKYKGDDTTHMGMIAQEVEKHHPKAVGESHGYKTVNYKHATHEAAERGHFASGGLAGRHGYATDGGVTVPFAQSGLSAALEAEKKQREAKDLIDRVAAQKAETTGQVNIANRQNQLVNTIGSGPVSAGLNWLTNMTKPMNEERGQWNPAPSIRTRHPLNVYGGQVHESPDSGVVTPGLSPATTAPTPATTPKAPAQGLAAGRPAVRRTSTPTGGGLSPIKVDPTTLSALTSAPIGTDETVATPATTLPIATPEPSEATKALYSGAPISDQLTGPSMLGRIGHTIGGLGHKAVDLAKNIGSNPDILIPILAGLGAAGSSDTVDTLSKVSAGLTGGAEAMQGIREFKAKRDLAEAQGAQARATAAKTATEAALGDKYVTLANGQTMLAGVWKGMAVKPKLSNADAVRMMYGQPDRPYEKTQEAAPAPADMTTTADAVPQDVRIRAAEAADSGKYGLATADYFNSLEGSFSGLVASESMPTISAANTAFNNAALQKSMAAKDVLSTTNQLANVTLNMPAHGIVSGGALNNVRMSVIQPVNDLISSVLSNVPGFPEDLKGGIHGTDYTVLGRKLNNTLAFAISSGQDQSTIEGLRTAAQTVANPSMSREEAIPVLASGIITNSRPLMLQEWLASGRKYMRDYHPGQDENYDVNEQVAAFDRAYPPSYYAKAKDLIELAMNTPLQSGGTFYQAMVNRKYSPEFINRWAASQDPNMGDFTRVLQVGQ